MLHLALVPMARPATTTLTHRISAIARTWWHSYRQKRRVRATVRILQGLDDRTLKDIGLDRSEIESVAGSGCAGRRLRYFHVSDVFPRG
jgi:uncharacterized protein YjiS (DUF1127 family)